MSSDVIAAQLEPPASCRSWRLPFYATEKRRLETLMSFAKPRSELEDFSPSAFMRRQFPPESFLIKSINHRPQKAAQSFFLVRLFFYCYGSDCRALRNSANGEWCLSFESANQPKAKKKSCFVLVFAKNESTQT
jgi:hypothetical protein